ncbi:MAG: ABC transporter permease [Longimicrobiales bacterium]
MHSILTDIRVALRQLARSPGFALVAVLTIALGIGANTAIFSVVNALVLRPPAHVGEFDRLVSIYTSDFSGPPFGASSYPDVQDYAAGSPALSGVAAYTVATVVMSDPTSGRDAELVLGQTVTGNYFDVMRVAMAAGRAFTEEEARGGASVMVLGHAFWQTRFGGDPAMVGRSIRLAGRPFTVIGIAPEGFNGLLPAVSPAFHVPMEASGELYANDLTSRRSRGLLVAGRLAEDATVEQARAQLTAVGGALFQRYPESWTDVREQARRVTVMPARQAIVPPQVRGPVTAFAAVLMAVVAAVLLICCANIANLLLVRATGRQREIGVRLALGAGRGRLVRQLLTESMVLAGSGAVLGIGLAYAGTRALAGLDLPLPIDVRLSVAPDATVLAFAAFIAVLSGLLFGLAPSLIATRASVTTAIRADTATTGFAGRKLGLRGVLAGGQIAVALVLLVMAGLLLRSLISAQSVDPGFRTADMLFVSVAQDDNTTTPERRLAFHRALRERVLAVPGVRAVSYVSALPLGGGSGRRSFGIEGYRPAPMEDMEINWTNAGPGYLDAMGITVRAGRDFTETDGPGAARVAIVNEAFARRYVSGRNPIGTRMNSGGDQPFDIEIVGLVRDGKYRSLGEDPLPFVFLASDQRPSASITFAVHASGPLGGIDDAVRRIAAELEPDAAVTQVATADQHLSFALLPQRAGAWLLGLFGLLGLALAALGIYGVMAFAVSRRSREIGVRMAIGARPRDVVSMIVRQGMTVAGIGFVLGLGIAAGVSRLLAFLLFGIEPLDPITFAGVAAIVAGVALVANWLPALRSTRVSPVAALKGD